MVDHIVTPPRSTLYRLSVAPRTLLFFWRYLRRVDDSRPLLHALAYTWLVTFRRALPHTPHNEVIPSPASQPR